MKTENKEIVEFYNEHPSIDFEKANLLLIEFLDKIFNHVTDDLDTNINSQILSHLVSSKKEFETLRTSVQDMNDKLSANSLETVQNINSQLGQIKKEYVEEMQTMISNGNINIFALNTLLLFSSIFSLFPPVAPLSP